MGGRTNAPRDGGGKEKGKKKNPKYEEAFSRLRLILREELLEYTFQALRKYVLKSYDDRNPFALSESVLDKILAGNDDARTPEVLTICAEYVRSALTRRSRESLRFDTWAMEFAPPGSSVADLKLPEIEGNGPAIEQANVAHTVADNGDARHDNSGAVSWLLRSRHDESVNQVSSSLVWPVSLAASVGLDRTSQVLICVGCSASALLNELMRVEEALKSVDVIGRFPQRAWSIGSGWLAEAATPGIIIDLSDTDLATISKDTIEGVVQRHFEHHRGEPAPSLVLASPAAAAAPARLVADALRSSRKTVAIASVDFLRPVSHIAAPKNLRSADIQFLDLVRDIDSMRATPQEALARAQTRRLQNLVTWLGGEISDDTYFQGLTARDLKIVVLSGRLGLGDTTPTPNAVRRSTALIREAASNSDLLYALGSLPIVPEIIDELMRARVDVRAVAGLITRDEMLAVPVPWFRKPVESWRHGRGLHFRGRQMGWVQAAS